MNYIPECDGLCSICKFRNTSIKIDDGGPCWTCSDNENFVPDWVDLICTHFHVSRNQAKKIYHNMLADWRIRKEMDKIRNGYKEMYNDNK